MSTTRTPQTVSIVHTSHPLACLLGLPNVDALSMDDGQIAPHPVPGVNGFEYSSLTITLHHTAHGVAPLLELVRTLQSLPCVCRVPDLPDSFTLRRADDGQVTPDGPCCLRFRMVETPACDRCPLHTTPSPEV